MTNEELEKVFNECGIQTRDDNDDFRYFIDVLNDLANKWNGLDDEYKRNVENIFR